jgi:hypothetical protein
MKTLKVKPMTNIQHRKWKIANWRAAFKFAGELIGLKTSKKTAVLSMMDQHKLPVREARNLYRAARNFGDKHKKRHLKAKAVAA